MRAHTHSLTHSLVYTHIYINTHTYTRTHIIVSHQSFSNCSSFQLKITTCSIRIWYSTRQYFRAFTLYCLYTILLHSIILKYPGICYHFYAADTQIYILFSLEHTSAAVSIIESCIKDVFSWLVANK